MELKAISARKHETVWFRMAVSLAFVLLMLGVIYVSSVEPAAAAAISDIRMTKHNLSKYQKDATANPNTTKSTTEDQVCVFCHTPHAATAGVNPLWNRSVATSGYTRYSSLSLDANYTTDGYSAQPGGSSVLCLSCHDGQVALGNVNVLNGQPNAKISVNGSTTTTMPTGSGSSTGYTRHIGTNLSNDHPISVTYDDALADRDGELAAMSNSAPVQRDVGTSGALIGIRTSGYKPKLPLQPTGASSAGQVQCATCHDPHLYDATDSKRKFLRLNRLQKNAAHTGTFTEANDIICLACHTKLGVEWAGSAHADSTVANETYTSTAATRREFPSSTAVWQAACLNCHDTHTVNGARRLLREGTDSTADPKSGGNSAIEETCYQCHNAVTPGSGPANALSLSAMTATEGVPDIKTEFARTIRMPIKSGDQGGGGNSTEMHDIGGNFNDAGGENCSGTTNKCGADMIEQRSLLGSGNTANRHVECTDCHNPHRLIRNAKFNATGSSTQRTHTPGGTQGSFSVETDGNVASGVLRGVWGVEPTYDLPNDWPEADVAMTVKRGAPSATSESRGSTWLTREYQLCFKCHSDFANSTTAASFPALRGTTYGGTASSTNSMTKYTNVAGEYAVNATDFPTGSTDQGEYGESTSTGGNDDGTTIEPAGTYPADDLGSVGAMTAATGTQNHRSWHPATFPTGRTRDERRMQATGGNILAPFDTRMGTQTMYCSDCHGDPGAWASSTGADRTKVQGPHGSGSNFLLKGAWSNSVTIGGSGLCFNCHNPTAGSTGTGDSGARPSGFNDPGTDNGGGHGNMHGSKPCMRCHIAVPHGWKNKAFLVNLNCTGPEAGRTSCDQTSGYAGVTDTSGRFTSGPYYEQSFLRVRIWRASGNWTADSCGGNNAKNPSGKSWMTDGNYC